MPVRVQHEVRHLTIDHDDRARDGRTRGGRDVFRAGAAFGPRQPDSAAVDRALVPVVVCCCQLIIVHTGTEAGSTPASTLLTVP